VGNVRALVELGSDVKGRDGRHMTPLDLCGPQSGIAKAIKEGLGVRWVRETTRKLLVLSVFVGGEGGREGGGGGDVAAPASVKKRSGMEEVEEEDGKEGKNKKLTSNKERNKEKKKDKLSWREARQRRRKPMPVLSFCVGGMEEGEEDENVAEGAVEEGIKKKKLKEGKKKTSLSKKEEAHVRAARLMQALFVCLPQDLRRAVVSFV